MANNFGRVNVSITASTGGLTAGLASAGKQLAGFKQTAVGGTGSLTAFSQVVEQSGGAISSMTTLLATFTTALLGVKKGANLSAIGMSAFTTALRTLLLPLGIIAAVVAPFRAIANAAKDLDDAGKSAERLGISVGMFQTLSAVAKEVGVEVSSMSSMLTKMQLTMVGAANGAAPAVKAFETLGLNLAQLQGKSSAEQFQTIATAIMAMNDPAQRTAAAVAVFGKNAAGAMAFIKAGANGAVLEMQRLNQLFRTNITEEQRQSISQMNDALGRLSIPVAGFINQLTGGIATAISTAATLVLNFLKKNTEGWNLADAAAKGFTKTLRFMAGGVTAVYGTFQLLWGVLMKGEGLLQKHLVAPMFSFLADWSVAMGAFVTDFEHSIRKMLSTLTFLHQQMMRLMASGLEKIGQAGLAEKLRNVADDMANLANKDSGAGAAIAGKKDDWKRAARNASDLADVLGKDAGAAIQNGIDNINNPFRAWDEKFLELLNKAREDAGKIKKELKEGGEDVEKSIAASSKELRAIVVGTAEGEAFRNMLARGGDARAASDAAKETADGVQRAADGIEELVALNQENLFGLAAINV